MKFFRFLWGWWGAPVGGPVVTPAIVRNPDGGAGCVIDHNYEANESDLALKRKVTLWDYIRNSGGLKVSCRIPELYLPFYDEPPWSVMPRQGQSFSKMFAKSPAAISGGAPYNGQDTILGQFQVPAGYDGSLNRIVTNFSAGTGFSDFSGFIVWRVQVGARFVRNLGNIINTFGSFERAFRTPGNMNIRLVSGQTITIWCSIPNGSPVANGVIAAGAFGWFYPRR
jgi:hypothetical protein